jgi:hypothetical protein
VHLHTDEKVTFQKTSQSHDELFGTKKAKENIYKWQPQYLNYTKNKFCSLYLQVRAEVHMQRD